ncbi:MAG: PHP-associated domain-containing protein [Chitinophagales bacterium]
MLTKYDLHFHSNYSDGMASIQDLEERCLRENIGVILTDHNEIRGSLKLLERNNIVTVPAIEAGTKEGVEFLIYFKKPKDLETFYKEQIEPFRVKRFMVKLRNSAEAILEAANEFDSFVSLAHPYAFKKKSVDKHKNNPMLGYLFRNIDAIEIFNGSLSRAQNKRALKLKDQLGKKFTLGSDGHEIESLGLVNVEFQNQEITDSETLYEELKANNFVRYTESTKVKKMKTGWIITKNHAKYFVKNGVKVRE